MGTSVIVGLTLEARLSSYLNVTVHNITYGGAKNLLCKYAGFSVYAIMADLSKRHVQSVCSPRGPFHKFRSLYSNSNKTLLLFYCYEEYAEFNVLVTISTTPCEPVVVNTCFEVRCNVHKTFGLCSKNFKQVIDLSNGKLEIGGHRKSRGTVSIDTIHMSVAVGACLLVQFVNHIDDNRQSSVCFVSKIQHFSVARGGRLLMFNITGFVPALQQS